MGDSRGDCRDPGCSDAGAAVNRNDAAKGVDRATLGWILLGAACLRVLWAVFVPVMPISDSYAYDTLARTLVEDGVFGWNKNEPFAFWPPGTSMLYALVYYVFGYSYAALVTLNILLSLGIIASSVRVAARYFGRRVGIATGVVLAAWPTLVIYPTIIASELPYLFFSILALDLWSNPSQRLWVRAIGAGLLLAAAALVRPLALLLPVVYGGAHWVANAFARKELTTQLKQGALAVFVMALAIAPWSWRNYQLYDEFVLISTNGGITFWMGNTPGTNGGYMPIPEELEALPDNEQSRILGERAKQYIRDDPAGFVVRSFRKLVHMYSNESIGVIWNADGIAKTFGEGAVVPLKRITQLSWALILLLVLIGTVALTRRFGVLLALGSPIAASVALYSVVYSITVAQDRYHLSFAAQLGILAAAGGLAVLDRLRARYVRQVEPAPATP